MMKHEFKYGIWCIAALLTLAACGTDGDSETSPNVDNGVIEDDTNFPLEDLDVLVGDHPTSQGKELARYDSKFDLALPAKFDVLDTQSDVANQMSRGVCSVFSTVGLMEHLYIKAGMANPDFSEQYLQWAAKFQGGFFPRSGGSSGTANITTINKFGIPEEAAWPYEGNKWTESDDAECGRGTEESALPTKCHTNGEPSQSALDAPRFFLPKQEYVSSYTKSLQTYIFKNRRAVVSGMDFIYQSWSHGGSKLGLSKSNKLAGAVVYPGPEALAEAKAKPAGHSILLIGWDENITFPRLDTKGEPLRDADDNIVYDKGFFIFKNSWGKGGSWGSENPYGSGYGYLSFRYVQEFGRSASAAEPKLEKPMVEICGDGIDNDANGSKDCEDSACSSNMSCSTMATVSTFESAESILIPDNDTMGIQSKLDVMVDGKVAQLKLTLDIDHSWTGDLDILLISPSGEIAVVAESNGDAGQGIKKTIVLEDFNGEDASGVWTLDVSDKSRRDEGQLLGWSLEITH